MRCTTHNRPSRSRQQLAARRCPRPMWRRYLRPLQPTPVMACCRRAAAGGQCSALARWTRGLWAAGHPSWRARSRCPCHLGRPAAAQAPAPDAAQPASREPGLYQGRGKRGLAQAPVAACGAPAEPAQARPGRAALPELAAPRWRRLGLGTSHAAHRLPHRLPNGCSPCGTSRPH